MLIYFFISQLVGLLLWLKYYMDDKNIYLLILSFYCSCFLTNTKSYCQEKKTNLFNKKKFNRKVQEKNWFFFFFFIKFLRNCAEDLEQKVFFSFLSSSSYLFLIFFEDRRWSFRYCNNILGQKLKKYDEEIERRKINQQVNQEIYIN